MEWKKSCYLSGSLTVEASLVMVVTLFLIASLLTGAFDLHKEVVGRFLLQDGLEQAIYMEEGESVESISEWANRDWQEYFWCKDGQLSIREQERTFEGNLEHEAGAGISVKKFDPEQFLRLLRAAGV